MGSRAFGRNLSLGFLVCCLNICLASTAILAVEISECMDCHGSPLERVKSTGGVKGLGLDLDRFSSSVHGSNGLVCTDCHSDIENLNMNEDVPHGIDLAEVNCGSCHDAESAAYGKSVHATGGKTGEPVRCYNCHEYHYVTRLAPQPLASRVKICAKCHNAPKIHTWLPQNTLHFSILQCAVCHAPGASVRVGLRLCTESDAKLLNAEEFAGALGVKIDGLTAELDRDKNGAIGASEFFQMYVKLAESDKGLTVLPEISVWPAFEVHAIFEKGKAVRQCETCHSRDTKIFGDVQLVLGAGDGTIQTLPIEPRVLSSLFAMHNLYAVGGTRVSLLDYVGGLLILGGVLVVSLHLIVRILTIPVRNRRK